MIYQIAEIAYNINNKQHPWYITRSGTVSEQGGLALGTESSNFETIEDACEYLSEMIKRDERMIKEQIERRTNGLS